MKTLIIGSYNYEDAFYDLKLLSLEKHGEVMSPWYIVAGIMTENPENWAGLSFTNLYLGAAKSFTEEQDYPYFYGGMIPKTAKFDKIVAIRPIITSTQEAYFGKLEGVYTTDDATETYESMGDFLASLQ